VGTGTETLWDGTLPGFGLRIGKHSKTFIVMIGKGRRHKVGRYPLTSLADARADAKRILAEKTLGKVKPKFTAFADARDEYLKDCEARVRPSTYIGYKSRLMRLIWDRNNLADITAHRVLVALKTFADRPMEKRYLFVVLRSFFNWCLSQHLIDTSPMARLEAPPKGDSRERVLTTDELIAVWHACPDDDFGRTVRVLMLTGLRRGEVAHLKVEGDLATIAAAHSKNKRTHTIPLPLEAQKCLTAPLAWSGWGKCKDRLDAASKVANWTLHDLRRTYATCHAKLGTPPHVIEALLNHKTGQIAGVAAVYNRYQYLDEMRTAVAIFERWINTAVLDNVPPPGHSPG
jgi:integrase